MEEFILNEDEQLSPVVVVTTIVLVASFGLAMLYRILLILL